MEPTAAILEEFMYPTAMDMPNITPPNNHPPDPPIPWQHYCLNPKNLLDSLSLPPSPHWCIDGCDIGCSRFFAVPTFALGRPPRRLDVYLPKLDKLSAYLRTALEIDRAVFVDSAGRADLGIGRFVVRVLEKWSEREGERLERAYYELPYGSRIVVSNIATEVESIEVDLVPNYAVEQAWLSLPTLKAMWGFEESVYPPEVSLGELELVSQPHEAISLVRLPRLGEGLYVFKSLLWNLKFMYHELHCLLSLPPSPYLARPLAIVTEKCRFGGKIGIVGFVLQYFSGGTLRTALSHLSRAGSLVDGLSLATKLRWAREVTAALMLLHNSAVGYYSDLKPDNVLLSSPPFAAAQSEELCVSESHIVLVDLEQRGGWASWSPPEINYIEHLDYLASFHPDSEKREYYVKILRRYAPEYAPCTKIIRYSPSDTGFNTAWRTLSPVERTHAMVYMLGKIIWCLFEEKCHVGGMLTLDSGREMDSTGFPGFENTPQLLKELIRACTDGAPEWSATRFPPLRGRGLLWAEPLACIMDVPKAEHERVLRMEVRYWWEEEIKMAEKFLKARSMQRNDPVCILGRGEIKWMVERPRLKDVHRLLQEAEDDVSAGRESFKQLLA